MLKAVKVRIYPDEQLKLFIAQLLGCCRVIYNSLLSFNISFYKDNSKGPSSADYQEFLKHLKEEKPWLKDVHSKVLQQTLRDFNQAMSNFFRRLSKGDVPGFPKFKSKKDNILSCRFPVDAVQGIKGNRINLIRKLNNLLFKCSVRDEKYLNKHQDKIHSVTLTKAKTGKYFLSILIDNLNPRLHNGKGSVGIDLGLKDFIVTSDGEVIENPHFKKSELKHLKHLHRMLSKKTNGGKNRNKARIKLAKAYEKITNKKIDFLLKLSSKLIDENQIICLEDLNVKGMVKNHKLAEAIQEVSWSEFVNMLEYKAKEAGVTIIKVNRFYPSSKNCHNCGYIYKELTLDQREWICPNCGEKINRDFNAALNILDEGLRLLDKDIWNEG